MTTDTAAPQSRRHALADALMNQSYAVRNGRTIDHIVLEEAALELRTAAARSEAQPSGYDGGESLGERPIRPDLAIGAITVAMKTTTDGEVGPWLQTALDFLTGEYEPLDDAALTFTASLSDASEVEELKARLAHVEALGRAGSYKATPEHSWQEWADEWRREALASEDKLKEIKALARQFSPVMSTDEAHSFGDALHKLLSPSSGDE